ncbi:hypothetical protein [Marinitenerispora sediminis]|uniref:Uncharacterized protein n=1 Tax=Marinitenerispora sediminis TaxID=1931232 RepID=A0A368T6E7_9ACTN|nr:hypothetical protein [Marinitenerispora sediminis]RCV49067.1 hypothetical protein DEF28_21895 [Marinitenerispora sediminis]RCV51780.1 hypothetical protein DEF23_19915 [Marinitenerispora sediminis]RCV59246.1 hypothetical protein DEF24_10460 [Marinitenerispora sediminis]
MSFDDVTMDELATKALRAQEGGDHQAAALYAQLAHAKAIDLFARDIRRSTQGLHEAASLFSTAARRMRS